MSKTWLITGGAGFIGTNLCKKLYNLFPNDRIIIVDSVFNDYFSIHKEIICYGINILDYEKLEEVFKIEHPNYVIHLAAKTDVRKSLQNPYETYQENINGILNCIDISYRKEVDNFVFISSCGIVGDVEQSNEESAINSKSPYADSKAIGESICSIYSKMKGGFHVNVLRLSNVYGKHSLQKNSVIPKFIKNILNKEDIVINGDGEQTRDFVYVDDVINIILKIIKKKRSGLFCVSSFNKITINNIVENLSRYIENYDIKIKHKEKIEEEVVNSLVDNTKIKKILGINFDTNIKNNIIELFDWFQKEMKGNKNCLR